MGDKLDEILDEVKATKNNVNQLKSWLYGQNGFEGDIPEIKKAIKKHNSRIRTIELTLAGLVVSGGGIAGIVSLVN